MTRTDGEHELILGNKQLLSAFFVVVILLGVFFTMGYFVGKNTATAGFNPGTASSPGGPRADAAGKPVSDAGSPASSNPAPDSTAAAIDPNAGTTPAPPTSREAALPEDSKPETRAEPKTFEAKPPSGPTDTTSEEPASTTKTGSEQLYLQVSAVRRPDAENMVKLLREHHFPALLGESSKQGLYRVLVGPFKTMAELSRTKGELKAKGFESIVVR
jgi:cell division septation protein DedD